MSLPLFADPSSVRDFFRDAEVIFISAPLMELCQSWTKTL